MKREDIEKICRENNSTLLSFPDRGPWGENSYRGNCSGWIQAFLIWRYRVQRMFELFAGSGTGSDVARDMGIAYIGADLNPNPKRRNIITLDATKDEVPDAVRESDFIFMHPPYGAEINIPYAGSMYKDPTGKLSQSDLGQMQWKKFMKELNHIIMQYFAAMPAGSKMAVLMGDVRRNGKFYSMFSDIVKPGELEQVFVKAQHNCVSNGRTYAVTYTPIVTETMMVIKKINALMISFNFPKDYLIDIRDADDYSASWKDVIMAVVGKNNKAQLHDIYRSVEGHKKAQNNKHYKEKVRQTLYFLRDAGLVKCEDDGYWAMTA